MWRLKYYSAFDGFLDTGKEKAWSHSEVLHLCLGCCHKPLQIRWHQEQTFLCNRSSHWEIQPQAASGFSATRVQKWHPECCPHSKEGVNGLPLSSCIGAGMAAMRIQPHCVDLGCGIHIQTRDADFHKGRTRQSYMPWIWEESPRLPSIAQLPTNPDILYLRSHIDPFLPVPTVPIPGLHQHHPQAVPSSYHTLHTTMKSSALAIIIKNNFLL